MNIVFFDGVCRFCNGFVDFLMKRDKKGLLCFSPLQGRTIQTSLAACYANEKTIVFVRDKQIYVRSRAVIESIAMLGGFYRIVKVFLVIPTGLRDGVYRFVARHRYQWFGKRESCRVPTKEEEKHFLE